MPQAGKSGSARRVPLIIGVTVVALALVAGGAFAAVRMFGGGPALPGASVQLKVTGAPPSSAGNWASGVREVWKVSGTHDAGEERSGGSFGGLFAATGQSWGLFDVVGDIAFGVWSYDPATGASLWNNWDSTAPYLESCASQLVGDRVPCLVSVNSAQDDAAQYALALVNWRTGKAESVRPLDSLGIKVDSIINSDVNVVNGEIVLTIPKYPDFSGPEVGRLGGVVVAKVSPGAERAAWAVSEPGCDNGAWNGPSSAEVVSSVQIQHGLIFTRWGLGFDLSSGKSLVGQLHCVAPVGEGVLLVAARQGDPIPSTVAAPDGFTYAVTPEWSGLQLVDQNLPLPLKLTNTNFTDTTEYGDRSGTAGVTAFDASSGAAKWATPVRVAVETSGQTTFVGQVSYDGRRLIIQDKYTLQAVDPNSGAVLWTLQDGDEETYHALSRLNDGTILLHGYSGSFAVDPETGAELWERTGDLVPVPNPEGGQSLVQVGGHTDDNSYLARLDPADRPAATPTPPTAAPACPTGMSPISWTQYTDGSILLCQADQRFAVVYPSHPDWQAAELNFTDGGHEVVFANGTRVRVVLGGSVVYTDASGTVTSQPATQTWSNSRGEVRFSVPADVKTCPAGSWPISLSTFDGGWLLVCGTTAGQPISMVFSSAGIQEQVGSVTYRDSGYCGTSNVGEVCAYRSPAVVSVKGADGSLTQHSASSNYFDGHGQGGAGEGTGSYGVDAPEQNAKDQVRYLTQILQKSMAGRANLDKAVSQVRSCTDLPGAISTMNDVVANRQQLLDALDSTPVDAIPDGSALVAKLRNALQLSHDSDLVWVQWAQSQQANGCADGESSPLYQQVRQLNQNVAVAKDDFLSVWNTQIAPTYGAARFKTSQI